MSEPNGIIIGTRRGGITGRALARQLNAKYVDFPVNNFKDYDYIFRYGNGDMRTDDLGPTGTLRINTLQAVQVASNKIACRKRLLDMGIPVPKLFWYKEFMSDNGSIPYPIIARPPQHFQGRDFHIVNNLDEARKWLMDGYYFQEIIDKQVEYRAFMFAGKIFEINEKVQTSKNADMMVRNHRRGWSFSRLPYQEVSRPLRQACLSACNAIDIHWAALDCCLDQGGNPYILEINSAPGLIPRKVERLAESVIEYVKERMRPTGHDDDD